MSGTVRIRSLELENFKNVGRGKIETGNTHRDFLASVVAIYGQNGSGKTAIISALSILSKILKHQSLTDDVLQYIRVGEPYLRLAFRFDIAREDQTVFHVSYEFKIRLREYLKSQGWVAESAAPKAEIFDEILTYSAERDGIRSSTLKLADTSGTDLIRPRARLTTYLKNTRTTLSSVRVARQLASERALSFIFSGDFYKILDDRTQAADVEGVVLECKFLVHRLRMYGAGELFVIDTRNSGLISMDILPFGGHHIDPNVGQLIGNVPFSLVESSRLPLGLKKVVESMVDSINVPLSVIIPNLTIRIKELQRVIDPNNAKQQMVDVELIAVRNGTELPLRQESEGIKKIVSILHFLAYAFNKPEITLAVDELDSGIFEYLLGDLLYIFSTQAKGQLFFTSHNLRPLETIDRGFIVFTTTDPDNRYVRMPYVKETNNLRDLYFRTLKIGSDSEKFGDPVDRADLSRAFRKAWKPHS